jgi:MFS family permease
MVGGEQARGYAGWRVVWACAAGSFFAGIPLHSYAIFLRPVSEQFGWTRQSASTGYAMLALMAAIAAPLVGRLIDRIGARRVIIPSLAAAGVALMSLSTLTSSLTLFYVICGVIGLAAIGASPVAYSRVIFGWFDAHRGRALGAMLAGGMVSSIVAPPITVTLIRTFGWRTAWLVLGAAIIGGGVIIVATFVHERAAPRGTTAGDVPGATIGEALRSRLFWTLIVTIFGAALMMSGSIVHVSALLTDRGLSAERAALVMSIMGGANLLSRLGSGWLLDRYAAPRVAALQLTVGAIGGLLMANAATMPAATVAAFLIGAGSGGEIDVNPYLLARYFGLRSLATLYGFNWMALGIASAIGPILMGRAFDATRSYSLIFTQLAIVTWLAAGLMLTLPARRAAESATVVQPAG